MKMSHEEKERADREHESILLDLCGDNKRVDPAYADDLWSEIEKILGIKDRALRYEALDLPLIKIIERAVNSRIQAMTERGDFQ